MSELDIKVVKLNIKPHPNAEKLEVGLIGGDQGYRVVVGKGQFKNEDLAIFIVEDAVVPENIQNFLTNTQKIEIKNGRIRTARIRGHISEGLCLTPSQWLPEELIFEGSDVKEYLKIEKYEPPPPRHQGLPGSKGINHHYQNEHFKRYTSIENYKKYSTIIKDGEEVVITKKFHGSNHRAGVVSRPENSLTRFEKIKKFFGLKVNSVEYLVGSHNTIRQKSKRAEQVEDVYRKVAEKYDMETILNDLNKQSNKDVIIFSEIIGAGIQVGYDYAVPDGEHELRVFDIMIDKAWLDWDSVIDICQRYNLPVVEAVYRGPWDISLTKHAEAIDEYNGKKYVREGVVIKPVIERKDPRIGRVILKYISETFRLDKKNTAWH